MNRQTIIIGIVAAAILLLAGAGALAYGISQGGSLPGLAPTPTPTPALSFDVPNAKITPPPDLATIAEEVRQEYPELADLLENPELGSVYKDFYLAYQQGGEEAAIALARQRSILNDNSEVEMTLVLDTEDTDALVTELEAEGVIVKGVYRHKINIAIPVSVIEEQVKAEQPDLIVERISNLDHVIRIEVTSKATPKQGGVVLGQGVNVTLANEWQAAGLTGQGVKVGVLDLGFAGYEELLGQELPENVTVEVFGDRENFDTEVHGTACAEIIHEMAPDAELYLAYYDGSDVAMGLAVDWLMSQGVDIISNSTGSNGLTPLDGTGIVAEMVDGAHEAGIFWVNAAGNEADVHWRGVFNDPDGNTIHQFGPENELLPFIAPAGYPVQIILSWDDWQTVDQDYDFILADKQGNVIAKSEEPQDGQPGQLPAEGFIYIFDTEDVYTLAIQNYENGARGDATLDIFVNGGLLHPDFAVAERSLSSPADARGAFAVGAVNWADDVLEPYSSQGPTADDRLKPDLAAPSVVDSASYAPEAFNGTSAAAPHVAGATALVLQAFPDASPDDLAAFLQEHSKDLGPSGPDNAFGAGRLNLGEPAETVPAEPPAVTEAEPGETPAATETEPEPVLTEEAKPTEVAEILPTSTPRPPIEVGLPGQTGLPQPPTQAGAEEASSAALTLIVSVGLCLVCVGGLLFVALLVAGLFLMRRKK